LEPKKKRPSVHRDWAVSLGGGSVAQSMFPAKYTFSTTSALTSASCTNDFVVYGLNVAGTTGGQANLVALNELYTGSGDGYCGSYSAAQPYWAYNATTKGGKVTTSPVLSLDGTKVMYVESGSNGSYLHILAWYSGDGGTPTFSKAPTNSESYVSACPASASCLVTVTLSTSSTHTITYSSPFYDYTDDVLYVGDDDGTLYKVTPVLAGTAAPTVTSLVVSSGAKLTSPVYDFATGNVFVAGSYNLYAVKASTMALQTHSSLQVGDSSCTSSNNIIYDGPLVDSSNDWVYEWATTGADGTHTIVVQRPIRRVPIARVEAVGQQLRQRRSAKVIAGVTVDPISPPGALRLIMPTTPEPSPADTCGCAAERQVSPARSCGRSQRTGQMVHSEHPRHWAPATSRQRPTLSAPR
jgi:hypothetical protein